MPKDNEVDEKVTPVAWWVPNARSCQDGSWEEGPGYLKFADETDGAERKYGTALYSAATVAELRAEVEDLKACCVMYSVAEAKHLARADAAERRVGELEAALKPLADACYAEFCSAATELKEPNISKVSYPEETCNITFGMIRNARKALTGADPT